jgi:hypothetical protein
MHAHVLVLARPKTRRMLAASALLGTLMFGCGGVAQPRTAYQPTNPASLATPAQTAVADATETSQAAAESLEPSGDISQDAVKGIVQPHHARLASCVATDGPSAPAAISMHVRIARDGSVPSVRASAAAPLSRSLQLCLESAFLSLRFPAPTGGPAHLVYPLRFSRPRR